MKGLKEGFFWQFALVSLAVMGLLALLLSLSLGRSIQAMFLEEAVSDALETPPRLLRQLTPEDLTRPMTGERYESFNRFVRDNIVSQNTARVKIWNRQGMVIYSEDPTQIGQVFPIDEHLALALDGQVGKEISVPSGAESARERYLGTLIEVYTPLVFPATGQIAGSFEIYRYYAPYAETIAQLQRQVYILVLGGLGLLYLSLVYVVARGANTISRQRSRLENSLQEILGLNKLLQGHLARYQQVAQGLEELRQEMAQNPPSQLVLEAYQSLTSRLQELARLAESPRPE